MPSSKVTSILAHCHSSPYGGHFGASRIASRVLESGFFWPTLFQDARKFIQKCEKCQRLWNTTKRDEMPLSNIPEVELFDV